MILEPDEIVAGRPQIFLPELDHCVWPPVRPGVLEPDRFQRSKTKRLAATSGQFFNWQASLEERDLLIKMGFVRLGGENGIYESFILIAIHRTVHVIIAAIERLAISRSPKGNTEVDCFGFDDRTYGVVKVQSAASRKTGEIFRKGITSQRPRRDNYDRVRGHGRQLFPSHLHQAGVLEQPSDFA